MSELNYKNIAIAAVLVFVLVIGAFIVLNQEEKYPISDEEMIYVQADFMGSYAYVLEQMTDSYSAYLSHETTEESFKKEVSSMLEQFKDIDEMYEEFMDSYDFSLLSESAVDRAELLESSWDDIRQVLILSQEEDLTRDEVLALYTENIEAANEKTQTFIEMAGFEEVEETEEEKEE
jgi:hypothetical protein